MLCQFTVKNYKSIRDEVTFDMQAAAISEHKDRIIKDVDGELYLPVSAIYGPNGGGKSNVLEAINTLVAKILRPIYATADTEGHVFLNKNEFYEESYLPQNMLYVSSIIDKINVNFNYEFQIEENINTEFSYKVIGELSIMDNNEKNSFYQKEFTLLENQVVQMKNEKSKKITENITVDFMHYNNIANDFKKKFSVTTSSNFVVKLIITKNSLDKNITFNGDKNLNLIIPLSQREIRLTTDSINEENNIVKKTYVEMTNYFNLVIAIIFIIITIILTTTLYKKIKLILPHKSVYDKFVSDILNEYDRYIINTKVKPNLAKNITVTKLDDFQELLDVRYNTKLPIKFYNITPFLCKCNLILVRIIFLV